MKNIQLTIDLEYKKLEELNEQERRLVDMAIRATERSYAKYSHFAVGAALLLSDGEIVIGANQENAAFPSGLCAERTALFAAQVQKPEQSVEMIAIAARNENGLLDNPITPCGACRQVMVEIEERYHRPMKTLLYGTKGVYIAKSSKDLLPLSFIGDDMIVE